MKFKRLSNLLRTLVYFFPVLLRLTLTNLRWALPSLAVPREKLPPRSTLPVGWLNWTMGCCIPNDGIAGEPTGKLGWSNERNVGAVDWSGSSAMISSVFIWLFSGKPVPNAEVDAVNENAGPDDEPIVNCEFPAAGAANMDGDDWKLELDKPVAGCANKELPKPSEGELVNNVVDEEFAWAPKAGLAGTPNWLELWYMLEPLDWAGKLKLKLPLPVLKNNDEDV